MLHIPIQAFVVLSLEFFLGGMAIGWLLRSKP